MMNYRHTRRLCLIDTRGVSILEKYRFRFDGYCARTEFSVFSVYSGAEQVMITLPGVRSISRFTRRLHGSRVVGGGGILLLRLRRRVLMRPEDARATGESTTPPGRARAAIVMSSSFVVVADSRTRARVSASLCGYVYARRVYEWWIRFMPFLWNRVLNETTRIKHSVLNILIKTKRKSNKSFSSVLYTFSDRNRLCCYLF